MYTLLTYTDGRHINSYPRDDLHMLLTLGTHLLFSSSVSSIDEFEIINNKGHVIAYVCLPDSKKATQLEADYEIERQAALEEDRRGHYD